MRILATFWLVTFIAAAADPPDWQTLTRRASNAACCQAGGATSITFKWSRRGPTWAGTAHAKIILADGYWSDLRFKARVKLVGSTTISLEIRDNCSSREAVSRKSSRRSVEPPGP
jgi:hypothetical protein